MLLTTADLIGSVVSATNMLITIGNGLLSFTGAVATAALLVLTP
jgi:hypothetical protein